MRERYEFKEYYKIDNTTKKTYTENDEDENYKWNYSKENWLKALDLAVKLFKGEEV